MNSKNIILLSFLTIFVPSIGVFAGSFETKPFKDLVRDADLILYGSIDRSESHALLNNERIANGHLPETYTKLTMRTANYIASDGLRPITDEVNIYLQGGIVDMPRYLQSKFPDYSHFGTLNSAVPTFDNSSYKEYVFFICDNGRTSSPLCNGYSSVFLVDLDGSVKNAFGQSVVGHENGRLSIERTTFAKPVPIVNTEPPRPEWAMAAVNSSVRSEALSIGNFADLIGTLLSGETITDEKIGEIIQPSVDLSLFNE